MKKKLLAVIAAALLLTGCGENIVPATTLEKLDVENYVTIGEYAGLSTEVEVGSVEQSILEGTTRYYYKQYVSEEYGIKEGVVKNGDTVNIAFEGKKDGVAFAGGTSDSYDLGIGSGSFIAGFEDGLIGVAVGDTVDLNLTFPENYGSAELAGQDVVFTVTVHYIFPEKSDDVAKIAAIHMGIEGVKTYDDLQNAFEKIINDGYKKDAEEEAKLAIIEQFYDSCTYSQETPDFLVALSEDTIDKMMNMSAEAAGTDVETFVNYYYQKDLATLKAETAPEQARNLLALQVIANKEGLTVSDEELETLLQKDCDENGYASVDAMIGNVNREYYRNYYMSEKVVDFIAEKSTISYK